MRDDYRFRLEQGSAKHICPNCHKKTYKRYIDTDNCNALLPFQYGRCNREHNCAYDVNPYKAGYLKTIDNNDYKPQSLQKPKQVEAPATSYIPFDIYEKYDGDHNNLAEFLISKFGKEATERVLGEYDTNTYLGTIPVLKNSIVYWQIDRQNKIRSGKIMPYEKNGKRVKKDGVGVINWVHKVEPELRDNYNLKQCLFGLHLLSKPGNNGKSVYIVESEKTALICSIKYPNFVWLATGGIGLLNADALQDVAQTHPNITIIPDLGAYDKWRKAIMECDNLNLNLSTMVENLPKFPGCTDLADYILKSIELLEMLKI